MRTENLDLSNGINGTESPELFGSQPISEDIEISDGSII